MKKNILLISFDDAISYWAIRSVFGEDLSVPNLDRICASSIAFKSAYCQAPVCGPSRASFMTGRTPHELGIFDNAVSVFDVLPASALWPARLKEAGYFCSSGGKIHHGYVPLNPEHHAALYSDHRKPFLLDMSLPQGAAARKFGGHRGGWGTTDPADDHTYYDHQSANSAVDFLNSYDGEAPFYREVGFYSPHGPHITPARFKEMYTTAAFRTPPEWETGFGCDDEIPDLTAPPEKFDPRKRRRFWRDCVRNYFSAYSHGDYHLGRVWDALKASRHADNTLVIICSDHGFHLGDRGRFSKFTLFEQATRVPLIVHDPGRTVAKEVTDPVALLDLGPTVLDWAGLPRPEDWSGRSLLPYLRGERAPDRAVLTVWDGGAAIRKGDYRLIRYRSGSTQLFDVVKDYWQVNALGTAHPAYPDMSKALDQMLHERQPLAETT